MCYMSRALGIFTVLYLIPVALADGPLETWPSNGCFKLNNLAGVKASAVSDFLYHNQPPWNWQALGALADKNVKDDLADMSLDLMTNADAYRSADLKDKYYIHVHVSYNGRPGFFSGKYEDSCPVGKCAFLILGVRQKGNWTKPCGLVLVEVINERWTTNNYAPRELFWSKSC